MNSFWITMEDAAGMLNLALPTIRRYCAERRIDPDVAGKWGMYGNSGGFWITHGAPKLHKYPRILRTPVATVQYFSETAHFRDL